MALPAEKIRWVNETRVLENAMPLLFQKGWPVISELVQNAQRAGAKTVNLNIGINEGELFISDDGQGIKDVYELIPMLVVGDSKYDDPDVSVQRPAGMGFYALLSSAREVFIKSGFGSLTIERDRWLKDPDYRDGVFDRINTLDRAEKVTIIRALDIDEKIANISEDTLMGLLSCYDVDCYFNGKFVAKFKPEEVYKYHTRVDDVDVYFWDKSSNHGIVSGELYKLKRSSWRVDWVNWYGHLIGVDAIFDRNYNLPDLVCYMKVSSGYPFNPKLPDRDQVVDDQAWQEFQRRVHLAVLKEMCKHEEDMIKNPNIALAVAYADKAFFDKHSPVCVFACVDSYDPFGHDSRLGTSHVARPKNIPTRVAGPHRGIRATVNEAFQVDVDYLNEHLLNVASEDGKRQILTPVNIPEGANLLYADIKIETTGDQDVSDIVWSRTGALIFEFEDGVRWEIDLKGDIVLCGDWFRLGSGGNILAFGGQTRKDLRTILEDNQYKLFIPNDDDSYETQEWEFAQEFEKLINQVDEVYPIYQALREARVFDPEGVHRIEFFREGGDKKARIVYEEQEKVVSIK